MIYFFKNLSSEEKYNNLQYDIPLVLYKILSESSKGKIHYYVAKKGKDELVEKGIKVSYDQRFIQKVACQRKMDAVLYGYFTIEEGKPHLFANLYFTDQERDVPIGDEYPAYFKALGEIKGMLARRLSDIANNTRIKKRRVIIINEKLMEKRQEKTIYPVELTFGIVSVGKDWKEVYNDGYISGISFTAYPRPITLPIGIGVKTHYIIYQRKGSSNWTSSSLYIVTVAPEIGFLLHLHRPFEALNIGVNMGMAFSSLQIGDNTWGSVDPMMGSSCRLVFHTSQKLKLFLHGGYIITRYKDYPLGSWYGGVGIIFL